MRKRSKVSPQLKEPARLKKKSVAPYANWHLSAMPRYNDDEDFDYEECEYEEMPFELGPAEEDDEDKSERSA